MAHTGVDFCLDVHSEEELPYVFLSKTPLGIPNLTEKQESNYHIYTAALEKANPEFQTKIGYKMPAKGGANMVYSFICYIKQHHAFSIFNLMNLIMAGGLLRMGGTRV